MAQEISAAERALKRELESYKIGTAKLLVAALVLLGFGVVILFFFSPSPDGPTTGWLYQTFGERGPIVGAKVFGIVGILLAGWIISRVRHRMTAGVTGLEERSRQILGLPPAGDESAPSQVGRLLLILGSMLAVIAIYYLSGWYARTH